jgi:hypothetical protein
MRKSPDNEAITAPSPDRLSKQIYNLFQVNQIVFPAAGFVFFRQIQLPYLCPNPLVGRSV